MVSSRCKNCKLGLYLTVLRCIMYIILCPFKSKDFLFTLHFSLPYNPYSLFPWIKMSTFANTLAYPNHSSRWDNSLCHLISREKVQRCISKSTPFAPRRNVHLCIFKSPPLPGEKWLGEFISISWMSCRWALASDSRIFPEWAGLPASLQSPTMIN